MLPRKLRIQESRKFHDPIRETHGGHAPTGQKHDFPPSDRACFPPHRALLVELPGVVQELIFEALSVDLDAQWPGRLLCIFCDSFLGKLLQQNSHHDNPSRMHKKKHRLLSLRIPEEILNQTLKTMYKRKSDDVKYKIADQDHVALFNWYPNFQPRWLLRKNLYQEKCIFPTEFFGSTLAPAQHPV